MVLVALTMATLCAVTGLSVDLGMAWTERRSLITASDAGALAAANELNVGGDGCAEADIYIAANSKSTASASCQVSYETSSSGTVTVTTNSEVDYFFAPIVGFETQHVQSITTARWGVEGTTGLRPTGICEQANDAMIDWLGDPSDTATIRIDFNPDGNAAACAANGSLPGNWGFIDFNGGANSNSDITNWLANGYSGEVYTTSTSGFCSVDPAGCYEANPGALSGSHKSQLETLVSTNEVFPVALFATAEGNGAGAQVKITKIAAVRLVDFRVTGKASKRYLEFEFQSGLLQDGNPVRVAAICSVTDGNC